MEVVNLIGCAPDLIKSYAKIVIISVNVPLSIIAFLGNALIIASLLKPLSSLHPASKLLFGSLACTDLCVGIIIHPLFANFLMTPQHSERCFVAQIPLGTLGMLFCGVSLKTLSAIIVDRFLVLKLGLKYREVVTLRRVQILVAGFWLFDSVSALVMFYNVQIATNISFVVLILCTVTSTFCYTKIYIALRHHQIAVQDQGQQSQGGNALNMARYRKTVSSALWLQLALVACYFPHGILLSILAISGSVTPSLALTWALTSTLFFFNSSLNPFLYCWKMREIRKAARETIRQVCGCFCE